ncbi:MAG: diacylglycerol kinase family protein [Proteobacteria bacterium]|nr:diacylglycerol kinase family protein [Pseudomonadota bacterium]
MEAKLIIPGKICNQFTSGATAAQNNIMTQKRMETKTGFTFTGRLRSINHAIEGIKIVLLTQHNAWIHAFATLLVVIAGILFSVSKTEWIWLIIAIVMVWVAEALNTAFELLCDVTSPEFHPIVKKSKDVAAGSVLISAIGSIIIGALVFLPRIYNLLNVNIKL